MSDNNMVERVAEAMWNTRDANLAKVFKRGRIKIDKSGKAWEMLLQEARAAIEAMREPTYAMRVAMVEAGDENDGFGGFYDDVWRAAIDAALNPSSTEQSDSQQQSPERSR